MIKIEFGAWLLDQAERKDPVGDLARDLTADDGCDSCADRDLDDVRSWGVADVVQEMDGHRASGDAYDALDQACAEWTGTPVPA